MFAEVLHSLGYGLCHQLPERSLFGGGVQVPVCARDTGIYLGFMASLVVVALLHRGSRPTGFPRGGTWAVLGLLVGIMALDGVTSYAGARETTNQLRLFTGFAAGYAIAVLVVPMLNDELWTTSSRVPVIHPPWRLFAWLATLPLSYLLVWHFGPSIGVALPVLVALAILATLTAVNLVIVAMLPRFDRRGERFVDLAVPILIALGISLMEIWLAGAIRSTLVALASGLVR